MTTREEFERYFLTRALEWRDTLDDFDAETVAEIMKLMNKLQREIRGELFDNADSLTDFRRVRIEQLDEWLSEVLGGAALTTSSFITEAAVIAAMSSLTEYNAMMSLNGASSVVQTVGFTREQLVTWFQDTDIFEGMKLTTRVQNAMSAGVKQSILDSLRKAGLEGKGTREAVRGVIQSALDEGFTITEREAVTLTRSYIQAANVGAMDAVMEANRELLRGWRWAATLDTRTCFLCASLDGKMYKLGEESPPMPRHFRCRCIKQWITNNPRDWGVPDDEVQRVIRPWVEREPGSIGTGGRKILNAGTTKEFFGGWWKTLSQSKQDAIIGPTRAALLRDGSISWDDLVEKKTGHYRTLKELGFTLTGEAVE